MWIRIPPIIKPAERVVWYTDPQTGYRRTYINRIQRDYGFNTVSDSGIHIHYGIQPGSWSRDDPENSDHSMVLNYPWNHQHIRHSYYFLDGSFASSAELFTPQRDALWWPMRGTPEAENFTPTFYNLEPKLYKESSGELESLYKIVPYVDPYDGEEMEAKVNIEEREWIRGKWPWLRSILKFVPNCRIIQRVINIEFSKETGPRKGSWKGGTTGTSHTINPGETVETALHNYKQQEQKRKK